MCALIVDGVPRRKYTVIEISTQLAPADAAKVILKNLPLIAES